MSRTPDLPRVVLVTGAAGGLGRGLVAEFLRQGWHVAAGEHRHALDRTHDRIVRLSLDVTDPASITAAVATLLRLRGRIDALVYSAGVTVDQPVWTLTPADWDRVNAVNLRGAALCARAVLGPMIAQGGGQIIPVGSFAARVGPRGQAAYAASKAGLIGLTQSLAREAGAHNVRANVVLPGVLPTPFIAGLPPARRAALAAANALGRLNDVDEVARFIAFLAGTRNVSGQCFQLDSRVARWT